MEMYRFSTWQDNKKSLDSWLEWFASLGIKTEVRKNHNRTCYAIFREGIDHTESVKKRRKNLHLKNPTI